MPSFRRTPFKWLLGVGSLLLLLLFISMMTSRGAHRRNLLALQAEWTRMGLPASIKEHIATYNAAIPHGANGAPLLLDAAAAHTLRDRTLLPTYGARIRRATTPTGEMLAAIREHVGANAEALSLIDQARQTGGFHFRLDLSQGFNLLLPHLSEVRNLVALQCNVALLQAGDGRPDAACDALEAALDIATALDNEVIAICHLVRISMELQVLEALERLLSMGPLPMDRLETLQQRLSTRHDPDVMAFVFAMEAHHGQELFDSSPQLAFQIGGAGNGPGFGGNLVLTAYTISGLKGADRAFHMRTLQTFAKAALLTGTERMQATDAAEAALSQTLSGGGFPPPRIRYLVSAMLLPALSNLIAKDHTYQARLLTAATGCAVERYRLDSGSLPPDLEALVPRFLDAVPSDPWTDAPLRYRLLDEGSGFVVYSVGRDGLDHGGGIAEPGSGRTANADDAFLVRRFPESPPPGDNGDQP